VEESEVDVACVQDAGSLVGGQEHSSMAEEFLKVLTAYDIDLGTGVKQEGYGVSLNA
jgi:hypothetical protein